MKMKMKKLKTKEYFITLSYPIGNHSYYLIAFEKGNQD
jgi:hypothetical protein